nr:MAG TPA: hypothetical protein [Caudoviricetes sp.]
MPTTFQLVETTFPNGEGKTTQEQINGVYDYLFVLLEQLRYTLFNLDESNLNQNALSEFIKNISEPIYAKIEDTDKNVNDLSITAKGLAARISDAEGDITEISATVDGLQTSVSGKIDGQQAQSLINQSLGSITLSAVSGSSGTVFQISKDGAVLASTGNVDIHVKSVNIDGTLTAGAVRGDTVAIMDGYGNTVGGIIPVDTSGGFSGMGITSLNGGIKMVAPAGNNIYLASGAGNGPFALLSASAGTVQLGGGQLVLSEGNMYGPSPPTNAPYGAVFFRTPW